MMCCVWSFLWFVFEWIIRTAIKPFKIVSSRHRMRMDTFDSNSMLRCLCGSASPRRRRAGRAARWAERDPHTDRTRDLGGIVWTRDVTAQH